MKLEEYEHIMRTGTPSDRARAIAAAGNDKELSEEEFYQLTALIKGAVRPSTRKLTPDEARVSGRKRRRPGEAGEEAAGPRGRRRKPAVRGKGLCAVGERCGQEGGEGEEREKLVGGGEIRMT